MSALAEKAIALAEQIARMTTSAEVCEMIDDSETLDRLIWQARDSTGIDGPEAEGEATGTCRECGDPTDDGEGWDGLCGNCADRRNKQMGEN
jgi:hypothetical protein